MSTQLKEEPQEGFAAGAKLLRSNYAIVCAAGLLSIAVSAQAFGYESSVMDAPLSTDSGQAAAPEASPARFDKDLGLKGWDIPFPSFGDSILQDEGGFRSALAQYGIGFMALNYLVGAENLLDTPQKTFGKQVYWGQSPSAVINPFLVLTVDMGHYGIPGGQLQFSGVVTQSTWQPYAPDAVSLNYLAYYQTLFDNKVEVTAGYFLLGQAFLGSFLGGNIASPFGPSAAIQFELGQSSPPATAPAIEIKVNITDRIYDQTAVQRSLPPTPNPFFTNAHVNPTGFNFEVPGAKEVYVNELSYKNAASPNDLFTWIRAGAMYNNSQYTDYASPFNAAAQKFSGTATNSGYYLLADRQIVQFEPSSKESALRGLYIGGSVEWAAPETNIVTQYYEARAYIIGPFPSRLKDQVGLVFSHQEFSPFLANFTNRAEAATGNGMFARYDSNTITPSYTYHIQSGIYFTGAVAYTDHPSFIYGKNEGAAFNVLASLFTIF